MKASTQKRPRAKTKAKTKAKAAKIEGFEHKCDWRTAAIKLARCVVWTLQTDGKCGVGSGMVMKVVDGKKIVERWDKDFIEALAFIGIEVGEKPARKRARPSRSPRLQPKEHAA